MSPSVFEGVLHHLKENNEEKLLETLAELEKSPSNDLSSPEELLFGSENPLQLSRKFSSPSAFLSQSSFNDILTTRPRFQLPLKVKLAISTLDKVVMESLLLAKPKDSVSGQYQIEEENNMKKNHNSVNSLMNSSPTKIPTQLCSFNFDSNAIASIMSSSASNRNNELNLSFCHDWWFANDSRRSPPVETKIPPPTTSSSTNQVAQSSSRTSRSNIPNASRSTSGRASKRQAPCSSTKFSTGKGNLQITPSSSHSTLQTVKIMLNTGDHEVTDGSDGENTSTKAHSGHSRKLPNTHKKGRPSVLLSSRRSPVRRSRQASSSRARRSVSTRASLISHVRAPRLRKNARGRKRAPKH